MGHQTGLTVAFRAGVLGLQAGLLPWVPSRRVGAEVGLTRFTPTPIARLVAFTGSEIPAPCFCKPAYWKLCTVIPMQVPGRCLHWS